MYHSQCSNVFIIYHRSITRRFMVNSGKSWILFNIGLRAWMYSGNTALCDRDDPALYSINHCFTIHHPGPTLILWDGRAMGQQRQMLQLALDCALRTQALISHSRRYVYIWASGRTASRAAVKNAAKWWRYECAQAHSVQVLYIHTHKYILWVWI